MDGGRHALTGFVYQATVILDVLLHQFERCPSTRARPEGLDDLVFEWHDNGVDYREFLQIKKPAEDDQGHAKPKAWTLGMVARDLLPPAIEKLSGNQNVQRWILGDDVSHEVRALLDAGTDAPTKATQAYVHAVHLLARDKSAVTANLSETARRSLGQWRFDVDPLSKPDDAVRHMVEAFCNDVSAHGCVSEKIERFKDAATACHRDLPYILSRICIESTFGQEETVRKRVYEKLSRRYPISPERIEHTVFRNCRAFVDDIAKKRDVWIGSNKLDDLIQNVWPEMMVLREPPALPKPYIEQRDLIDRIELLMPCRAIEIVGVSGSGKTSLARAIYEHTKRAQPEILVFYAEVHRARSLREVLASITFELRKRGFLEPSRAALSMTMTEEHRAHEVANALRTVPHRTVVLVDLVQGDCDGEFARMLAAFLTAEPPERFTLVILGQESALEGLSTLERENLGIPARVDLRGFYFEEFVSLCAHFHAALDRERLWDVYHLASAGRVAGLLARLGYDLANVSSIDAMERIVEGPADQMVSRAIRARFDRIPDALRGAAEKLACIFLPFRLRDAIDVFPEDRIRTARDALIDLGLLSHHDTERLEMHETVRRCLEDEMPPAQRRNAHAALAAWYGQQGDLSAEIYHLDSAGSQEQAHQKARDALFSERHFGLSDYVARNRVISGIELADTLLAEKLPEKAYIIPRLMRQLGDVATADKLLAGLRLQAARFDADYNWARWMTESILACDPARLYELALFALAASRKQLGQPSGTRIERIQIGAGRVGARVDERLLGLFDQQEDRIKWSLLGLLLIEPRGEVLKKVLSFVNNHEPPDEGGRGSYVARNGPPISLRLADRGEVLAFLGAIPLPKTSSMLILQSPEFGQLTELVWSKRLTLKSTCVDVLSDGVEDETVLENALRVLMLLRDEQCLALTKQYRKRHSRFGNLCALVPPMFSEIVDKTEYYDRLLDPNQNLNDRVGDFSLLAMLEGDPWRVFARLEAMDPVGTRPFRFLALTLQSTLPPSESSIPVLEEFLKDCTDEKGALLWAPLLTKLGELPGAFAENMLIRALSHPAARVRLCAALSLQCRRSKRALDALISMVASEQHDQLVQTGLVAIVASGPTTMEPLTSLWTGTEQRSLWRCILAGRLRAENEAAFLVETATDPQVNWQLRRAAILAASRLPFESALAKIVEPVMRERSPFRLDKNHALLGHAALSTLLRDVLDEEEHRDLVTTYGPDRVLRVWYDQFVEDAMFSDGTPSGAEAAQWALGELRKIQTPSGTDLQRLIDGIHTPILHAAVLRGLRMAERHENLEEFIRTADSEWLLLRAMCEYGKCREVSDKNARLQSALAGSQFPESPYARNVANDFSKRTAAAPVLPKEAPQKIETMTMNDIVAALQAGTHHAKSPFVIACDDENEFLKLVELLDPARDYTTETVTAEPRVTFVGARVTVGGVHQRQSDNHAQLRRELRPAVAAANNFQARIAWHAKLLTDRGYLVTFLKYLGAANNPDRFYQELNEHGDIILSQLDDITMLNPILKLVDARMVPHLHRFASVGTDGLLECLCSMALRIDEPAIDPVLSALFRRWHSRFDRKGTRPQHVSNNALWRALGCLRTHPRFRLIPAYEDRLMELLNVPLRWWDKDTVVKILSESARSYARLECMLFKAAPFAHYYEDEVERLDKAADNLFRCAE